MLLPMVVYPDYAYFSSTSSSWCAHAEHFVELAVQRLNLGPQAMWWSWHPTMAICFSTCSSGGFPAWGSSRPTPLRKLPGRRAFPPLSVSSGRELAHRWIRLIWWWPTTFWRTCQTSTTFLAGIACLLKPTGLASIECPHLLRLLQGNQFDTRSITSITAI